MGLSAVGGICYTKFACTIAEMGVKDHSGKPYPSSGFTSVFVIAHELGHNLGMSHDNSKKNGCSNNGFIMSATRGTDGEVIWSSCSRNIIRKLDKPCLEEGSSTSANGPTFDHNKYGHMPGLEWSPDSQCQFYTQKMNVKQYIPKHEDKEHNICLKLHCKEQNANNGYYTAGPALEGTLCGTDQYCRGGECVYMSRSQVEAYRRGHASGSSTPRPLPPPAPQATAKYSEWSTWSACQSECILRGKGARNRTRTCVVPRSVNSQQHSTCQGPSSETQICEYNCKAVKRVESFATNACQGYKKLDKGLARDLSGNGKQYEHNNKHIATACTIYCQKKNNGNRYYSPVVELSDYGEVNVYFPDGTFCHKDATYGNYYCKNHLCLPEGLRSGRAEDVRMPAVNYNLNARPQNEEGETPEPPEEVKKYFTLDNNGKREREDLSQLRIVDELDDEFLLDDEFALTDSKYQPKV